jgi:hypothetical protein
MGEARPSVRAAGSGHAMDWAPSGAKKKTLRRATGALRRTYNDIVDLIEG